MKPRVVVALILLGSWARMVSGQVPAGGEFQVNRYTTNGQAAPSIGSDAAGNFVVVWDSEGQDGSYLGVFAQRYDVSGAPRGAEFQVNGSTSYNQMGSSVAVDSAGNFVVAWTGAPGDGSGAGVFAQRYDASGARRGSEFQVNSYTTADQSWPSVASDASGNFVVVWQSHGQDGSDYGVFAQRYDASGARRGSEFQVSSYTTYWQESAAVASNAVGDFVVAWMGFGANESDYGVFAQRYDVSGSPRGAEFRVNTVTFLAQRVPSIASDRAGNFVVAWESYHEGGSGAYGWLGVFAQRFDASGAPRGSEFQVNSYTTSWQYRASVASDAGGNFVVVWMSNSQDGDGGGIFGQRFDSAGAKRGAEFRINSHTTESQRAPGVASDAGGNFVVAWESRNQDGNGSGLFAQRFGGLLPAALAIDASLSGSSDGNGVLEPGETAPGAPSWRNVNGAAQTFGGNGLRFDGPPASGVSYLLADAAGSYGTVANGATAPCSDCYAVGIGFGGTRPAAHWDATFTERLTPDALGQTKPWLVHVGASFSDVPKASPYYRFVETLLHKNVTGGCSASSYCPTNTVTREQMSVFVLVGKEGASYGPPACTTPLFADVSASSPFCRWIEELARRGVASGCGGGNYCPTDPVTREQMSVFLLHTLDPVLNPPACTTPVFSDVPASSPFCRWIEELARRGVTSGCGGGSYCPTNPVTREQMAVFISATFALSLYGS